jgi:hypothetical protein
LSFPSCCLLALNSTSCSSFSLRFRTATWQLRVAWAAASRQLTVMSNGWTMDLDEPTDGSINESMDQWTDQWKKQLATHDSIDSSKPSDDCFEIRDSLLVIGDDSR